MTYMTSGINLSPVMALFASADIEAAPGKAVKLTADGMGEVCSAAGEMVAGIITLDHQDKIAKDEPVTIQISGCGRVLTGGEVAIGDELATDANGAFVKSTSGYVRAIALEAGAAGALVRARLVDYKL